MFFSSKIRNIFQAILSQSTESVTVAEIYRSKTVFETLKDPFSKVYNSIGDI